MPILIALAAVVGGILNTVQSGANATLAKTLEAPILAALAVSAGNVVVYLAVAGVMGLSWPGGEKLTRVPWWAWTGGLMGACYVLSVIFLAQRLGAAIFTGLSVTAAITASVLLDHFGWVGFAQHTAGLWRIVGCLLMIGGIALVSFF